MANICTARVYFYGDRDELLNLNSKLQAIAANKSEIYIQDLKNSFKLSTNCDHRTHFLSINSLSKKNGMLCLKTDMEFAWSVDTSFLKDLVGNYEHLDYVYKSEETDNGFYHTNDYKQLFFDNPRYSYIEEIVSHYDIEIGYTTTHGEGNRLVLENHKDHFFPLYSYIVFENKDVDSAMDAIRNSKTIPELCEAIKNIFIKSENDKTTNYIDEVLDFYNEKVKGKTEKEILRNVKWNEANNLARQMNSFFEPLEKLDSVEEIENIFIIKILYDYERKNNYRDTTLLELTKKLHDDFKESCTEEDINRFCEYLNSAVVPEDIEGEVKDAFFAKNFVSCPIGYAWINESKYANELANRLIDWKPFHNKEYTISFSGLRYEVKNIVMPLKKTYEEAYFLLDFPSTYKDFYPDDYGWIDPAFVPSDVHWVIPELAYQFDYLKYDSSTIGGYYEPQKIILEDLQKLNLNFASKDEIVVKGKIFVFSGMYSHCSRECGYNGMYDAVKLAGGDKRQDVSSRSDYFVFGECTYGEHSIKRIVKQREKGHIIPIVFEDDLFEVVKPLLPQDMSLEDVLTGRYHEEILRKEEEQKQLLAKIEKEKREKRLLEKQQRIEERARFNQINEERKQRLKKEKEEQKEFLRKYKEKVAQEAAELKQKKLELKEQLKRQHEEEKKERIEKKKALLKNVQMLPYPDDTTRERMEHVLSKLEQFYPEHKAFAIDAVCGKVSETITSLYKKIGYPGREEMLAAYGYEVISGEEVKQLRNKVIYAPGNEPEFVKQRIDNMIKALNEYYPDHKIPGSLQNEHKKLASTVTGFHQWLGYDTAQDMLKAYAIDYDVNSTGGRPALDYTVIIDGLKEKYKDAPFTGSLSDFVKENPELEKHYKAIANQSKSLFGTTLKRYLEQQNILSRKL